MHIYFSAICKPSHGSTAGMGTYHSLWSQPGAGMVLSLVHVLGDSLLAWGWTSTLLFVVEVMQASGRSCSGLCSVLHSTEHLRFYAACPRLHHSHQQPGQGLFWSGHSCHLCGVGVSTTSQGQKWGSGVMLLVQCFAHFILPWLFIHTVFQAWLKPVSLILSLKSFSLRLYTYWR